MHYDHLKDKHNMNLTVVVLSAKAGTIPFRHTIFDIVI